MSTSGIQQRVHVHALERLNRICVEIQRDRCPNRADLARVVERHARTIQRDIDALRNQFNAPLIFDKERNGYRFTDRAWQLPQVSLSEGELIAFFAAERILRRLAPTAEVRLTRQALSKFAALLPNEIVIDIAALDRAITFAPEPILDADPAFLQKLASAAIHRRTLNIDYFSQRRRGRTQRDVDVLLLHNHLGEWYAVCRDHLSGEVRDFHAGRVRSIAETRRTFRPPVGWDADEYLKRGFGMFRGGEPVVVEIEFDSDQARYARERRFHPTEQRRELKGGRLLVSFETTESALTQVARWLMQYGRHARALAPEELVDMIREEADALRELYDERLHSAESGAKNGTKSRKPRVQKAGG